MRNSKSSQSAATLASALHYVRPPDALAGSKSMLHTKRITSPIGWLAPLVLCLPACTGVIDDGAATQVPGTAGATSLPGAGGASTPGSNAGGGATGGVGASGGAGAVTPGAGATGAGTSGAGATGQRGGTNVVPTNVLDPGRVVLRRLNRAEYDNTVRDLLGTSTTPAKDTFAADDVADGFDTIGQKLVMSLLLAEQIQTATETLVTELVGRPAGDAFRTRILACTPTTANAATCYQQILSGFMRNAYRRPVTSEEVQARVTLASSIATSSGDPMEGLKGALKSVLMSPNFLYRVELGDPKSTAAAPVNDYELATRLSYFLWGSMPDSALSAAADAKKLTPAGADLDAQIDRMLSDAKFDGFVASFAGQWLSTRDALQWVADDTKFPTFDDALRTSMPQETNLFFKSLFAEKQPLQALLLADYTYANDRLAKHYGIAAGQAAFTRTSLQGSPRQGILTQESFLTVTSYPFRTSPVRRADWILEHLLCDPPPPAPPGVPPLNETVPMATTLRAHFEQHRSSPACASCHQIMDPIGFALENFDAIGGYRTMDNGAPVDASGQLADGTPLSGAKDLAQAIAADADYPICLAKQLLTYGVGRSFSAPDAKAYAASVGLAVKDGTWPDLLRAVVKSQAFLTRRGEAI